MNHYRGPKSVDKAMHADADLQSVDLDGEPTWYARNSKQETYLKAVAFLRRQPLEHYNGYHDIVLYRGAGLRQASAKVVDVQSDHRAIVARLELKADP